MKWVCPYCNLHLEEPKDLKLLWDYQGCPACGYGKHHNFVTKEGELTPSNAKIWLENRGLATKVNEE